MAVAYEKRKTHKVSYRIQNSKKGEQGITHVFVTTELQPFREKFPKIDLIGPDPWYISH